MNKKNVGIKITSVFLGAIIAVSSVGYSLNKRKENNQVITTTSPSYTQMNEIDTPTSDYIEEEKVQLDTYSYDELLSLFDEVIAKFDKNVQKELKILIDKVYQNGSNLESLLNNFTSFETSNFVKSIIDALKEVKSIEIVPYDDYSRLNKLGYRTYFDDELKTITICNEDESVNHQRLLEEIMHVDQTDLLKTEENGNEFDIADYYIFGEGQANVTSWLLDSDLVCNESLCIMYDKDNSDVETLVLGTGYSYSAATKYYAYLNTLVGPSLMNKVRETKDLNILYNELNSKYGIDGEKFYDNMKDVIVDLMDSINNQRTNLIAPIENTFLSCLSQKLERLNSKEETLEFLELYRYLNIQYGYYCSKADDIDITLERVDKTAFEKSLFEKVNEFGILDDLSKEDNIKVDIFESLINPERDYQESIYSASLRNVSISYDEVTGSLILGRGNNLIITNTDTKKTKVVKNNTNNNGINLFEEMNKNKINN